MNFCNTSIIIPLFNQAAYTRKCLEQLFAHTPADAVEIIVVDNHSTDETPNLLTDHAGALTVITNAVNMGFATACNQGAKAASGKYLLFLNNDTEVQPGWLAPLVETLESDPDIGAVGSRLLYPDGRLQHAGVVVISQKDVCSLLPRHVFMGEDPEQVPADRPMCFQALTAACLMVRKRDFEEIGGFDEAYWNGCEDVDLCFRLGQAGKKLVYQPNSVVIHHESVSGQERLVAQPRNNARLRARWESVIRPDIIQEGWIARRGPSAAAAPLEPGNPDPVEYLERAAAWWTKREVEGLLARENRKTDRLTEKLNQSRQAFEQQSGELTRIRQALAQVTSELAKSKSDARELEIRTAELSTLNQGKAALLRMLQNDFTALVQSKRWQVGNAVVRGLEALMLRPGAKLVTDHIQSVFDRVAAEQAKEMRSSDAGRERADRTASGGGKGLEPPVRVRTDIVVCIHDAPEDVRNCLDSVLKNTSRPWRLILVNDGSGPETGEYLRQFAEKNPPAILLENPSALGYTRAANQGLKASDAPHVVLLNSDTIVPRLWLEALTECALSDPKIGIAGPLSNAASWQSVPSRFDAGGDWAVNELPAGFRVDDMAELVHHLSGRRFPSVAFVNGFCFLIKRTLIEAIGLLDEAAFPAGYGEENDYCLRAAKAGFLLAIADHAYVYHAKSRSYSHERRLALSREGGKALEKKHGSRIIDRGTTALRNQEDLAALRKNIRSFLERTGAVRVHASRKTVAVRFVLPAGGIGGGILSVVQEACGMARLGIDVRILTRARYRANYARFFPDQVDAGTLFEFYEDDEKLQAGALHADVLIATTWDSPRLIAPVIRKNPRILPVYYVQDYEPWFFEEDSEERRVAAESYTLIPQMVCMAKTEWLCGTLKRLQGVDAVKVSPGLDGTVFFPPETDREQRKKPISIVAMIRPDSPRRGAARTLRVLKAVRSRFAERVKIHAFGCTDDAIRPLITDFPCENHGVLKREDVAALYRNSAVFVDFSDYQAFGRTGLEAMACGCVPVLPCEGGVTEYAEDRENSLIVDTGDESRLENALSALIEDDDLRQKLRQGALKTAARFSVERAVLSELGGIRQALYAHLERFVGIDATQRDAWEDPERIKIALLLALRGDGKPCGSGHIRLLNPLSHPSVSARVALRQITPDRLFSSSADIVVVQRASVPDPVTAQLIIDHCRSASIRLVLEIDDDLLHLHHKTGNDVRYAEGYLDALEFIARNADSVVVSSPPLADAMREFNPDVVCVPNVHDERIWLDEKDGGFVRPVPRTDTGRIRILYMGTKTHEHDLDLIRPAYSRIRNEYGRRVELEIVGGLPDHIAGFARRVMPEGIGANSDAYCEFVQWFRKTNHWDFGVIPLEGTPFNRKKSYIKFLDYAAIGVSAVCSDIEPYREVVRDGENGLLVPNDDDSWYRAMKRFIEDPPLRDRLAANAFRDLTERHILKHRARDFLRAIAGDR